MKDNNVDICTFDLPQSQRSPDTPGGIAEGKGRESRANAIESSVESYGAGGLMIDDNTLYELTAIDPREAYPSDEGIQGNVIPCIVCGFDDTCYYCQGANAQAAGR